MDQTVESCHLANHTQNYLIGLTPTLDQLGLCCSCKPQQTSTKHLYLQDSLGMMNHVAASFIFFSMSVTPQVLEKHAFSSSACWEVFSWSGQCWKDLPPGGYAVLMGQRLAMENPPVLLRMPRYLNFTAFKHVKFIPMPTSTKDGSKQHDAKHASRF